MAFRTLTCPNCGGTLPPEAKRRTVVCSFCKASVAWEQEVVHAAAFRRALAELEPSADETLVRLDAVPYRLRGHLGSGASSEVFLAERAHPLSERVVLKVLRAEGDADLLRREAATLRVLQEGSGRGAAHFTQRLPQLAREGALHSSCAPPRPALALRYLPGFAFTGAQLRRAWPDGVDPRHAVWMWRRVLELLGWLHDSGWVHGAVLPDHLLVHPRDHGAMLVGWSAAGRAGSRALEIQSRAHRDFYPPEALEGAGLHPALDLAMGARCLAFLLGGDPATGELPASVPGPLAELVREQVRLPPDARGDARELEGRVSAAARQAFGAPQFLPFAMP